MTDKLTPTADGTSPLATVAMACNCPGRSCVASRYAASWAKAVLISGSGSTSFWVPESPALTPGARGPPGPLPGFSNDLSLIEDGDSRLRPGVNLPPAEADAPSESQPVAD